MLGAVAVVAVLAGVSLQSCSQLQADQQERVTPAMTTALLTAAAMNDAEHPAEALQFLNRRLHRLPSPTVADRFEYYGFAQRAYSQTGIQNEQKALQYADSMLQVLKQSGADATMPKALAVALFVRGDALLNLGRFREAYQSYHKARKQSVEGRDAHTEADYYYRIGMVLYRQGQYRNAAESFLASLKLAPPVPENFLAFYRQQELRSNIGLSYSRAGDYDSAGYWFGDALAFIQRLGNRYAPRQRLLDAARGVVIGNWGEACRLSGQDDQAGRLLRESIAINDRVGYDRRDAARTRMALARLYLSQGRLEDVEAQLTAVQKTGFATSDADVGTAWNELSWHLNTALGNRAAALAHLQRYYELRTDALVAQLATRGLQVRDQLLQLDTEQELSEAQRTAGYQRTFLWGTVGLLALCLIFAILVYRYWRRSKGHVETLTELHGAIRLQKTQLEHAMLQLEEEAQDKDRILRMVVHDLRNPIASVAALTDLLRNDAYSSPEERDEYLELIEQACGNSLSLINEILVATRGNSQSNTTMAPTDVVAIVKSSGDLLRFKAAEKNQALRVRLPDEPIIIDANGERIWRVVNNLVTNAIKFSPEGSAIDVTLDTMPDGVLLAVHDRGIGIPAHMREQVFDMFTEAKRPGTANEKPFGLGLAISRQIVEEHGGTISLESEENEGTSFFVFLPVAHPGKATGTPGLTAEMAWDSVAAPGVASF